MAKKTQTRRKKTAATKRVSGAQKKKPKKSVAKKTASRANKKTSASSAARTNAQKKKEKVTERSKKTTTRATVKKSASKASKSKATRKPKTSRRQPIAAETIDRSIGIGHDAVGNAIISGSGNVVVVQMSRREDFAARDATIEPSAIGPNPYKGLEAFHEEDADRFFGREEQVQRLWETFRDLHERGSAHDGDLRLLPILGPSGSGKSSLVRGGLIPELARRPLPGWKDARVAVLTPGSHPLESLAGVLARLATGEEVPVTKAHEFAEELKQPNDEGCFDGLRRIASWLPDIADSPLILLVDQFEEIFLLCDDKQERRVFIENLLDATSDPAASVSAIITLRTDFIGETHQHGRLNSVVAQRGVIVPAMSEDELRRAIAEPARQAGHPLDEATIDLLVNETKGREGALPLLQFALTRIWEGLAESVEPAETLKKIGGVGGALAGEAQRIYEGLPEDDKRIARRIFLGLVHLGEGAPDTRRRAVVASLVASGDDPQHVEEVIRRFSSTAVRLITLSAEPDGTETAEVTHEALFEHWRLLDEWLENSRDDLRFQRRLDQAARHWDAHKQAEGILWRQPDLALLEQYHDRAGEDMTPLQVDFYLASKEAEEKAIAERECQQKRLRMWVWAASIAALIAIVFADVSRRWYEDANVQREKAQIAYLDLEGAVDSMKESAEQESLSEYPGGEELRGRLLDTASEYYKKLDQLRPSQAISAGRAATLHKLGDVHRLKGEQSRAERQYVEAIQIWAKLANVHLIEEGRHNFFVPELDDGCRCEAEQIDDLAATFNWRGELWRPEDLDKAKHNYEQALALQTHLQSQHNDTFQEENVAVETALSRLNLGLIHSEQGQANEAVHEYSKAISQLEEFLRRAPKNSVADVARQNLARAYNNRAIERKTAAARLTQEQKLTDASKAMADARSDYESAIMSVEAVSANMLRRHEIKLEQAKYYGNLANLLLAQAAASDQSDNAELFGLAALKNQRARELLEELTFGLPSTKDELANSYNTHAAILGKQALAGEEIDFKRAEYSLQRAIDIWTVLKEKFEDDVEYKQRLDRAKSSLHAIQQLAADDDAPNAT